MACIADAHAGVIAAACVTRRFDTNGGDDGNRTHDLLLAKQALYQLSYVPVFTARSGYREKAERQDKSPTFRGGLRGTLASWQAT